MGRETREEFMFGVEPIEAWRMWDVGSLADSLQEDMGRFVRTMALAQRKAPENPWEYMLQPRLGAIARADSAWEPGEPLPAVCTNQHPHHAPHLDCECGYWALKTEAKAAEQALGAYNAADAIGRVLLWGRFCEFEHGYRAEYAYPAEVWLLGKQKNPAMAADLADAYGVPVHADEPAFLSDERARREASPPEQTSYSAMYSQILGSFKMPPLTFSGSRMGASYLWGAEPEAKWPDGIVRPHELWAEIQKQGAGSVRG